MRKINLKAKNLTNSRNDKSYLQQSSLLAGIVLLLISSLAYGGVWYLRKQQSKQAVVLNANIQVLTHDLDTNSKYKELYNFQDKLLELKKILLRKVVQKNILNQLSETTMNDNSLRNLKVTMNDGVSDVELTVRTKDFNSLAKQINSYGQIDVNKQALLKGSSLKDSSLESLLTLMIGNSRTITKNNTNK